jgi:uncharacterized protein (TIGR00251 family)
MRYEVIVELHRNFVHVNGNRITVGVTSKPERGQANRELIRKLAEHFQISTSHVRIMRGLKSKRKIVEIELAN